jgi:hypothetical protein
MHSAAADIVIKQGYLPLMHANGKSRHCFESGQSSIEVTKMRGAGELRAIAMFQVL